MRIVDAVYVNAGGGRVLLQLLVDALAESDAFFLLDNRVKLERMPSRYLRVSPGEFSRLRFYLKMRSSVSYVFCFGNVPPPIRLACEVDVYFHGPVILDSNLHALSFLSKIKFILKRWYIAFLGANSDRFLVQTELMSNALASGISFPHSQIDVRPFWRAGRFSVLAGLKKSKCAFGYVSLPYPHKNHAQLLDAWEILAARNFYPELHLTVPRSSGGVILARIDELSSKGIKIINHGFCDPTIIYEKCFWQIFPSLRESFGLGLIEAAEAGCSIVAPDLPYVNAVVKPSLAWKSNEGGVAIANSVVTCLSNTVDATKLLVENRLADIIKLLT